ncbi:MAG TPA: right-handed parallel beta-helix repeat-containing protein, partial [Chthoniobacterales bacterium]|nr:right-handed parallel beta-helix repeat-containing protein [Chthoniobacterales bacterium]
GGGVVYCPPGNYLISSAIQLKSFTTLKGAGAAATTLTAAGQMNGGVQDGVLNITMIASEGYLDTGVTQTHIYIMDLELYGNGPGNYPLDVPGEVKYGLITLNQVSYQGVYRCSIQSSSNNGIDLLGSDAYENPAYHYFWIVSCTVDLFPNQERPSGTGVSGFPIRGQGITQGYSIGNVVGFGNIYEGTPQRTNDAMDFVGCSSMTVTNNLITNCTDGIGTDDAKDVIITDNVIINPSGFGIASFAQDGHGSRRMVIARNTINSPEQAAIWAVPSADAIFDDAVVCDNQILFPNDGGNAIAFTASYAICHHNSIDLGGSQGTGIHCNVTGNPTSIVVDGNRVFNGSATGSIGILLGASSSNLTLTKNDIAHTATPMSFQGGTNLSTLPSSVIRGNLGEGVNPPIGNFTPPTLTLGGSVQNQTPFDCLVYPSGSGGTCLVSVGNAEASLSSTGLGLGVAYLVPSGFWIGITTVTGDPTISVAWIPQ